MQLINYLIHFKSKVAVMAMIMTLITGACVNSTLSPTSAEKNTEAAPPPAATEIKSEPAPPLAPEKKEDKQQSTPDSKNAIYCLNLEQDSKTDARKWLEDQGFKFESDAKSQDKLAVSFADNSLVLEAKKKLFGLIINGNLDLKDAKTIKITWGVDSYPQGANYEKGVNNEAVMVYVYFGDEKLSSGSVFIPNGPYFIGLYPGEKDKINTPYVGRHFTEGGRFICLVNPKPGETVTSEFDLDKGFKECFKKDSVPFISGIALEVETSSSGPSKGFIKKIEILK